MHERICARQEKFAEAKRRKKEDEEADALMERRMAKVFGYEVSPRYAKRSYISEKIKQALLIYQNGQCGKSYRGDGCGKKLPISYIDGKLTSTFDTDHIIPKSDMRWRYGGDCNNFENLQLLCPNCHAIKTRYTDRGRVIG